MFDRENVFVKKFEDIVRGDIKDICRIVNGDCDLLSNISISKNNDKISSKKYVYTGRDLKLRDLFIRLFCIGGLIKPRHVRKVFMVVGFSGFGLGGLVLRRERISKPSEEDMRRIKEHLSRQSNLLINLYGISY